MTLDSSEISAERSKINCDAIAPSSMNFTGVNEQFKYCRDRREVVQLGSSTVFPVADVFSDLVSVAVARTIFPRLWQTFLFGTVVYPLSSTHFSGLASSFFGFRTETTTFFWKLDPLDLVLVSST